MKNKRKIRLNLSNMSTRKINLDEDKKKEIKEKKIFSLGKENKSGLKKVAIVSSGGDAPGLNAVIRAIVKMGRENDIEVYGYLEGFKGIIEDRYIRLDTSDITYGIIDEGGTIIGTSNSANPFSYLVENESGEKELKDISMECVKSMKEAEFDCLFVLGGDGSLKSARDFGVLGINVIGIPKTIDNDVLKTDKTFGFDSAVSIATDSLARLETTAKSHSRIMVLEVMGRYAGWIALYAGIAGAADVILMPEFPYDLNVVANHILENKKTGKNFALVIVSEGAKDKNGNKIFRKKEGVPEGIDSNVFGGVGNIIAQELEELTGIVSRSTKLGHLQRGGAPVFSDRLLATEYGCGAMKLAMEGKFGNMISYVNGKFTYTSLEEVIGKNKVIGATSNEENGSTKFVPKDHRLIETGKAIGVCFGD